MSEKENPLAHEPFSFQETKDGKVLLSFEGRVVETLRGKDAERFLRRTIGASSEALQMLMAKATKNFKRGNERR